MEVSPANSEMDSRIGRFQPRLIGFELRRRLVAITMLVITIATVACGSKGIPTMTVAELSQRIIREKLTIIDTRDVSKFDALHMNAGGAISIADMDESLKNTSYGQLIVVSGESTEDPAAEKLAKSLSARGYVRVSILEGGFPAWVAGGYSTRSMADLPESVRPPHARTAR